MATPADRSNERGLALVSVLWAVSILSLIAASFLATSRSSYQLEASSRSRAKLQTAAEAGVMRAILGITDRRIDHRWRIDGVPTTLTFDNADLTVLVEDELGKIDINTADTALLKGLFSTTAKVPELADTLTDRILDWRESDDLRHLRGVGRSADDGDGHYRPRRSDFQSIDELTLVPGITADLFSRIRPALTVYSRRPTIDVRTAPREALIALPTMDESKVDGILADRLRERARVNNRSQPGTLDPAIPFGGRAFAIKVTAWHERFTVRLEAVVRLTADPLHPYWILAWR